MAENRDAITVERKMNRPSFICSLRHRCPVLDNERQPNHPPGVFIDRCIHFALHATAGTFQDVMTGEVSWMPNSFAEECPIHSVVTSSDNYVNSARVPLT